MPTANKPALSNDLLDADDFVLCSAIEDAMSRIKELTAERDAINREWTRAVGLAEARRREIELLRADCDGAHRERADADYRAMELQAKLDATKAELQRRYYDRAPDEVLADTVQGMTWRELPPLF